MIGFPAQNLLQFDCFVLLAKQRVFSGESRSQLGFRALPSYQLAFQDCDCQILAAFEHDIQR
jgi:hypothetical protein